MRLSAASLLGPCAALVLSLAAPCQTLQTVHVAVRVFDLNNEPVRDLTPTNFRLASSTGAPVAAMLESPQTHLLFILSPGQGDLTPAGLHALAHQLAPLWKQGWHISIHDAQGRQTAYLAGETALRSAIRPGAGPAALIPSASVPDAIGTLAEFPGHRIVFVQTGPSFQVDPSTTRLAMRYHAMLYRIGAPRSNRFQPGGCTQDQDLPIFAGEGGAALGQSYIPGSCFSSTPPTPYLHQEPTFRAATHDALLDTAAFYDLRTVIPSDTPTLALSIKPAPTSPHSYRVTAQPWAEDREPLPTITIHDP